MKLSEAYAIVKKKLDAAEVPYQYFKLSAEIIQYKQQVSKPALSVRLRVVFREELDCSNYVEYETMYLKYFHSLQDMLGHLDKIAGKVQGADTVEV